MFLKFEHYDLAISELSHYGFKHYDLAISELFPYGFLRGHSLIS
jgi:hypothetical protein